MIDLKPLIEQYQLLVAFVAFTILMGAVFVVAGIFDSRHRR
jgi:hypothetical protein